MGGARTGRFRAGPVARLLARCAVVAAIGAAVVLLLAVGGGGLFVALAALIGLVLFAAGLWWFVARRGVVRLLGALVAVAAPVGFLVFITRSGLWLVALISAVCWAVAGFTGREALRKARPHRAQRPTRARRPERPVLIMNPKSGGGKVGRFDLVKRAEDLGARVILLDPSQPADVTKLAEQAVAKGADLLGVAGGDGTQALVAAAAAEHHLPFLVMGVVLPPAAVPLGSLAVAVGYSRVHTGMHYPGDVAAGAVLGFAAAAVSLAVVRGLG